ncbi:MAG: energy transducer TonB, partial [Terracidiphilus sp.]
GRTQAAAGQAQTPAAAEQAQAHNAAALPVARPANAANGKTTTSPAHATLVLKQALGNVFASSLDARMMAAMPGFWKLYYQAAAAGTDFKPADPAVIPDDSADRKAKLLTNIEAPSNAFAQQCGVAGMALYHAVIGADGKPLEVAVARPIGFGLDEIAVAAIRKAKFQPAIKDGKPVPVLLDLVVEFQIYSKRTAVEAPPDTASKPASPSLPGPYSVGHP